MLHQLPLEFKFLDSTTFAEFFPGKNQELLTTLKKFLELNNKQEFFYLWGNNQVGKTHLLQACCNHVLKYNTQAMYLSLSTIDFDSFGLNLDNNIDKSYIDNFLGGLDAIPLLCLDDIHLVVKNLYLEEKLFHLFNNIRSNNNKLIVAANTPPSNLSLSLPDLKSRLTWGITYHLQELSEQEKITALIMRAEQVGLHLSEKVAKFLLLRIPRNMGELFGVLKRLDNASLVAVKRKLTIPFVRSVLGL